MAAISCAESRRQAAPELNGTQSGSMAARRRLRHALPSQERSGPVAARVIVSGRFRVPQLRESVIGHYNVLIIIKFSAVPLSWTGATPKGPVRHRNGKANGAMAQHDRKAMPRCGFGSSGNRVRRREAVNQYQGFLAQTARCRSATREWRSDDSGQKICAQSLDRTGIKRNTPAC